MSRVYVGGTFDLFHSGHVELLRRASKYGEVWVALNSDDYAASFKKRPIMDYNERAVVLLSCEYVKHVVCNYGDERGLIKFVEPRTIVYAINGDEYDRKSYLERLKIDEAYLDRHGIELRLLPYTPSPSSSEVIARVLQRHRCEPCQRDRTSEDVGPTDVPVGASGRDDRVVFRFVDAYGVRVEGTLPSRLVPGKTEPERLGS